jgi:transcriptional regulator with XRE-family HTH domain
MPVNDQVRMVVGANVKRLREARRVSVTDAAAAIGVHRSWWHLLENGGVNFTIEKLESIAAFFGVPARDLLSKQSEPPRKGRKAS